MEPISCERSCTESLEKQASEDPTATVTDTEDNDEQDVREVGLYLQGFHEFYMKKDQVEYIVPVIFEDGMDYQECEQYYASLKSHEPSLRSSLRTRLQRKSSLRELQQIISTDAPTCLRRKPRYQSHIDLEKAKVRRCSFGGTAPVPNERPGLHRSNSDREVKESSPGVSFQRDVQVYEVFHVFEYPPEIRTNMWMSRVEMRQCMQRAVAEKVAERRRQAMKQQQEQERNRLQEEGLNVELIKTTVKNVQSTEGDKKDIVQRQNSDNCVVAECMRDYLEMENPGPVEIKKR